MQIQKRTMGWLPRASLYNEAQAKRQKQKAAHQEFLSSQSNLMSSISAIQADQTFGEGNLVSQIAAARLGVKKTA